MRNKTGSMRAVAAVAVACLGCALGMSVTAARTASCGVRNLAVVQTALCILGVGLWYAECRARPHGAPAAACLFVTLGWGVLLAEQQWPGGVAVAAFTVLWMLAFLLAGAALTWQNGERGGRPAHVVLLGALCLGMVMGCCAGFLIEDERVFAGLLLVLIVPCAAAALRALWVQREAGQDDPCKACPAPCTRPAEPEQESLQGRGDCFKPREPALDGEPDDVGIACADLAEVFRLSAREREVMEYLARGHKAGFIATKIGVAEATVRSHVRNIYHKMGVASSEQLIQMVEARVASVRSTRDAAFAERVQRLEALENLRRGSRR